MAKLGTVTLSGESGDCWQFNLYDRGSVFNDFIPGIYIIANRSKDGINALAIEQSDNVDQTLRNHPRQETFDAHGYDCVAFYRNANSDTRNSIIADLTAALKPACAE